MTDIIGTLLYVMIHVAVCSMISSKDGDPSGKICDNFVNEPIKHC